jgi:hypothetical protein
MHKEFEREREGGREAGSIYNKGWRGSRKSIGSD